MGPSVTYTCGSTALTDLYFAEAVLFHVLAQLTRLGACMCHREFPLTCFLSHLLLLSSLFSFSSANGPHFSSGYNPSEARNQFNHGDEYKHSVSNSEQPPLPQQAAAAAAAFEDLHEQILISKL